MKLNSVHLFGILLLSLLLGSFLGRFIDIGDKYKEGNQNKPTNQHTGGDDNNILGTDRDHDTNTELPPPPSKVPTTDPSLSNHDNGQSDPMLPPASIIPPDGTDGVELAPFSSLFDAIIPSNGLELFEPYAPLRERLSNKSDSSKGITKDQIAPGQEHLYVLKSQVVPPSCPTTPAFSNQESSEADYNNNEDDSDSNLELEQENSSGLSNGLGAAFRGTGGSRNKKCPPCPACARCPEPSFDCKKVPNYSVNSNGSMSVPRPVLADFTQFGM